MPSRPGASSLAIATPLRSQSLGVPGEHRGLPDVVEAEIEHADALLRREKEEMLNHKGYFKLPNALWSKLEVIGRIDTVNMHFGVV